MTTHFKATLANIAALRGKKNNFTAHFHSELFCFVFSTEPNKNVPLGLATRWHHPHKKRKPEQTAEGRLMNMGQLLSFTCRTNISQ